jgi:hypothetical protein
MDYLIKTKMKVMTSQSKRKQLPKKKPKMLKEDYLIKKMMKILGLNRKRSNRISQSQQQISLRKTRQVCLEIKKMMQL